MSYMKQMYLRNISLKGAQGRAKKHTQTLMETHGISLHFAYIPAFYVYAFHSPSMFTTCFTDSRIRARKCARTAQGRKEVHKGSIRRHTLRPTGMLNAKGQSLVQPNVEPWNRRIPGYRDIIPRGHQCAAKLPPTLPTYKKYVFP